jgi:hypothetical protein
VRDILDSVRRTTQILKDNLDKLHVMADALLQYETIDAKQIDDIMAGRTPGPPADWSEVGQDVEGRRRASRHDRRPCGADLTRRVIARSIEEPASCRLFRFALKAKARARPRLSASLRDPP